MKAICKEIYTESQQHKLDRVSHVQFGTILYKLVQYKMQVVQSRQPIVTTVTLGSWHGEIQNSFVSVSVITETAEFAFLLYSFALIML